MQPYCLLHRGAEAVCSVLTRSMAWVDHDICTDRSTSFFQMVLGHVQAADMPPSADQDVCYGFWCCWCLYLMTLISKTLDKSTFYSLITNGGCSQTVVKRTMSPVCLRRLSTNWITSCTADISFSGRAELWVSLSGGPGVPVTCV